MIVTKYDLTYDTNFWELIRVPDDAYSDIKGAYSLHYIGPIVDGKIVGDIPRMDVQYRIFAGREDLIDPPVLYGYYNTKECFIGCSNLHPSKDTLERQQNACGTRYGDLYAGTKSPHIKYAIDNFNEIVHALTGKFIDEKVDNDFFSRSGQLDRLLEILDTLDFELDTNKYYVNCSGAYVNINEVHKSSELLANVQYVSDKYVISASHTPIHTMFRDSYTVSKMANDFVVDTTHPKLIQKFGCYLNNQDLKEGLVLGRDATLTIVGECNVTADCPIDCSGIITIKGTGTITLASGNRNTCIGPATNFMSYGRWAPAREILEEIIIDGAQVVCLPGVENFAIGGYGTEEIPKITCINGGNIVCPEVTGFRRRVKSGAENLSGSTKREEDACYVIEVNLNKMNLF